MFENASIMVMKADDPSQILRLEVDGDTQQSIDQSFAEAVVGLVEDKNGVTALYLGDELLGYNIFDLSRVLKLKAKGIIFTPGVELVTLVNQLLTAAGFPVLEELTDSGFHVFKVTKIEEHPLDEKAKIVTLTDGKDTYETVTKLNNLNADDKVVGLIDGYIAPDGMMFLKHVDHNIKNDVLLLSEKALKQGEDEN